MKICPPALDLNAEVFMRRHRQLRHRLYIITVGLFAAVAVNVPLHAQTLFTWPEKMPDVTRLTNVEDCLSATSRVTDSTRFRTSVWTDTLPFSSEEMRKKLPPRVIETAQRCSAQFVANTVPLSDFVPMLRLFLYADRDEDAETLIQRRLAAIPSATDIEPPPPLQVDSMRVAVLDTTIKMLLGATPARLDRAIPYVEHFLKNPAATLESRFSVALSVANTAHQRGDTALSRRWFERTVEIGATATEADKQRPSYQLGKRIVFLILMNLHLQEFADSLRVGTDGYVRSLERLWATIDANKDAKLPIPLGVKAPPLQAEYWFERRGTTKDGMLATKTNSVRPIPGSVNLVVFLGTNWRRAGDGWKQGYVLKRLKQRFPELEITVMSQTQGFAGPLEPPTPEQEAELYRKRTLEFLQWPVTLGVAKTPWWRLEEPDRRRIDEAVVSSTDYAFGLGEHAGNSSAFLIDPDGRLVTMEGVSRGMNEDRLGVLIHALMQRTNKQ